MKIERGIQMGFFSSNRDMGIDLGTANTLVFVKGKGIVLSEPSVVAINSNTKRPLAVGTEAKLMIGRTPGNIVAIRPLKDGVIADFDVAQTMLKKLIEKVTSKSAFTSPRIIVCYPSGVTEVERRAIEEAAKFAGARDVVLMEEPMAAAIGAGLPVGEPTGSMIVDIGGGTTDIAVISLGGSVVSDSIKLGGDKFDEAIIKYIKKEYNVLIGERSAEKLKIEIGTAVKEDEPRTMNISGRNLVKGLPVTITVNANEMLDALNPCVEQIVAATKNLLEKTPPELSADISDKGIVMTGGGAMLKGLGERIEESTGIKVVLADDPLSCVAKGTGLSLGSLDLLETGGSFKK